MTQTVNIISELVEALEGMALQYLSDLDCIWLEEYTEAGEACLNVLEKLGKVDKTPEGFYSWSKQSENHSTKFLLDPDKFLVTELPSKVTTEELVTALGAMSKEYLTYGNKTWMTHNFMSAGKQALDVLNQLGLVTTEDSVTYEWVTKR